MHRDNMPFFPQTTTLQSSDYRVHISRFQEIFLAQVPTSREVVFINKAEFLQISLELTEKQHKGLAKDVFTGKKVRCIAPDTIVFPLPATDRDDLAVLIKGIDRVIVERASSEWLAELRTAIEQELLRVKSHGTDPLTSLYNVSVFNELVSKIHWHNTYHVVLVAGLPPARSVRDAINHLIRIGRLLEEYNRHSFPLFHLGQSVFGFIIVERSREFLKSFCMALAAFVRNNGAKRIHIGFSSYDQKRHGRNFSEDLYHKIVDEAWSALQQAGKRGPFGFCDYDLLANPEHFPVRPVSRSTRARLHYRVKDIERFSLVAFKPDYKDRPILDPIVRNYLKKENCIEEPQGYLVIRKNKTGKASKKWAQSLIKKIKDEHGDSYLMSAGISSFPLGEYNRADIAQNCQKALLHGTFLGPGSSVIFDALSLNVSGDAYYGEGDLSGAVREYRGGLKIDAHDVNLLNSLGVTYGLMNRTSDALAAFEKVLSIDAANFMAWYNKGLGEQSCANYQAAVNSYGQALACFNKKDVDEAASVSELRYQLGLCYYHIEAYDRCITILEKWYGGQANKKNASRCCRFIGISYYHLDNSVQASKWLQRGLAGNESDAESLSLLGELYLAGKEGDEIALKLCEKSVELDQDNVFLLLRYGRVLAVCGHDEAALGVLKQCIRSADTRHAAWLEMAVIYQKQQNPEKYRSYINKVLTAEHVNQAVLQRARRIFAESE